MGNTIAVTLWEMLKVGALTDDEKKKKKLKVLKYR